MDDHDVVVLGATGFLGTRVLRKLRARGRAVRIATRSPELRARSSSGPESGVRLIAVDVRDRASLTRGLEGADAVINCVGHYVETRNQSFHDVHVDGARSVAEIAGAAGVRRLVHISGIGADLGSRSDYVRARAEGENAVRGAFPAATILRPSVMFDRDRAFFGDLDAIVRRLPIVPLFGDGRTQLQPVHVGDVAEAAARAIDRDSASGTVFELGGPDVFTYREILERMARRAGRQRLFLPVPFAFWKLLAAVLSTLPSPL